MRTRVIDTTSSGFGAADIPRLKAAGVGIVIGYVAGGGDWKHLHKPETDALRAAGIDIACVWEGSAGGMLGGWSAGASAANAAKAAVHLLGGPADPFVYFACDTDTSDYAAVNSFLDGAASVLGRDKTGIYGGYDVCAHAAGHAGKAWQTVAWSHGKHLKTAVLYQHTGQPYGNLGFDYDANDMLADDVGQWGYKEAPVTPPKPKDTSWGIVLVGAGNSDVANYGSLADKQHDAHITAAAPQDSYADLPHWKRVIEAYYGSGEVKRAIDGLVK